jgi:hypothetical protein
VGGRSDGLRGSCSELPYTVFSVLRTDEPSESASAEIPRLHCADPITTWALDYAVRAGRRTLIILFITATQRLTWARLCTQFRERNKPRSRFPSHLVRYMTLSQSPLLKTHIQHCPAQQSQSSSLIITTTVSSVIPQHYSSRTPAHAVDPADLPQRNSCSSHRTDLPVGCLHGH